MHAIQTSHLLHGRSSDTIVTTSAHETIMPDMIYDTWLPTMLSPSIRTNVALDSEIVTLVSRQLSDPVPSKTTSECDAELMT